MNFTIFGQKCPNLVKNGYKQFGIHSLPFDLAWLDLRPLHDLDLRLGGVSINSINNEHH